MRFINSLKSIDSVSMYPMFTLVLFVGIFVLASVLVFSKSRKTIDKIKNLPLED